MRAQNSVHCGPLPTVLEPYRYAVSQQTQPRVQNALAARGPGIAMVSPYPQTKAHKHQGCAKEPNQEDRDSSRPSRDAIGRIPDDAEWCGPGEMRGPELIENCTRGQNEIEACRHPNPILGGGAATRGRGQNPRRDPDDGGIQEVDLGVIQRAGDVLMHVLFLRGCDCSCCLPRPEEPLYSSA